MTTQYGKKNSRLLPLLLVPAILLCSMMLSLGVSAISEDWEEEDSGLDSDELFSEAEQDLEKLEDLRGAKFITVSDGQDVEIRTSGLWVLDGSASDVTVTVNADEADEVYLFLNGLTLENRDRPCFFIEEAGKVYLIPVDDCALTVSGAFREDPEREADGVIYSRMDLTLVGEAPLRISSAGNGIVCRDKLRIIEGEYEIEAGAKAIAADNAIWIAGGDFLLTAQTDALRAENKDDEQFSSVCICGGSFDIIAGGGGIFGRSLVQIDGGRISVAAEEGITSAWVLITGGTTNSQTRGDGIVARGESDDRRPTVEITGGTVYVTAEGKDAYAIASEADLIISGGSVWITDAEVYYGGTADHSGGTVIIDGKIVREIKSARRASA